MIINSLSIIPYFFLLIFLLLDLLLLPLLLTVVRRSLKKKGSKTFFLQKTLKLNVVMWDIPRSINLSLKMTNDKMI